MYANGIIGSNLDNFHSGNSAEKRARSRLKTIHGNAPFAPDNGPVAGIDQSA
jgi:hypothetical protein